MTTLETPVPPAQQQLETERKRLLERIDYLQNRQAQLDNDWVIMCQRLLDEANERDWCETYDTIVEEINQNLSVFKVPTRMSEQEYVLRLTITATATSTFEDDMRRELAGICDLVQEHLYEVLEDTNDITVDY